MIITRHINDYGFTGTVKLDMPGALERIRLVKNLNFKVEQTENKTALDTNDQVDMAEKMLTVVSDRLKEVDLKHNSGKEIKTREELEIYTEAMELLSHLSNILLQGVQLGNGSKNS